MVWTSSTDAGNDSISGANYFFLKISQQAFVMAHVLGLRRLQELVQGSASLRPAPACILGSWYQLQGESDDINQQILEQVLADFQSKIWCTYRRDFAALGAAQLSTDIGWGCTLRSGQMLLAEALMRHRCGRSWRIELQAQQQAGNAELLQCLQWLWDGPEDEHPFSIHKICGAGKQHGVVVGQWLGPWVLCKALEAAVNPVNPWGLSIHVMCDPGGGAPTLCKKRLLELFITSTTSQSKEDDDDDENTAAAAGSEHDSKESSLHNPAQLLLIPLTLGLDKVNPRYLPQLQKILTLPQSVGIVGGRPGSSLYFVGYQEDNVVYLDPHEPRQVAKLPEDVPTYFCNTLRLMPLSSIDPSLAIGFLCQSQDDMEQLCQALADLEEESAGAPLMTVVEDNSISRLQQDKEDSELEAYAADGEGEKTGGEGKEAGEWELV